MLMHIRNSIESDIVLVMTVDLNTKSSLYTMKILR